MEFYVNKVKASAPYITLEDVVSGVKQYVSMALLILGDYFMVVAALLTAEYIRAHLSGGYIHSDHVFRVSKFMIFGMVPAFYLAFLAFSGMYIKRLPFVKSLEHIFSISLYVALLCIFLTYFAGMATSTSRLFVAISWILSFVYLAGFRYLTKRMLVKLGLWEKPVIIIGAGKTAELLANRFANEPGLGYVIKGLVEDNPSQRNITKQYPVIGSFAQVERAVLDSHVKDVIIAVPGLKREALTDLVCRVQPLVKNIAIIPDLFGVPLSNMEVETLVNEKIVMLKVQNNLSKLGNRIVKRIFDIVVGSALVVMLALVLAGLMVLVKLDSKGPAIYTGKRMGKKGRPFSCYKFRTMYENADAVLEEHFLQYPEARDDWEKFAKLKGHDPRVTKVGNWLRKYSLDELPQLINVLFGEMSLVGPRPYLPEEKKRMNGKASTILETVPGITGLWQVSGRNEIEFGGRLELDTWYVRNWSLWYDIIILVKTVGVVLRKEGAY